MVSTVSTCADRTCSLILQPICVPHQRSGITPHPVLVCKASLGKASEVHQLTVHPYEPDTARRRLGARAPPKEPALPPWHQSLFAGSTKVAEVLDRT